MIIWGVVVRVSLLHTHTLSLYRTVKNFSQANKGATASGGSVRFPVQTSHRNRMEKVKKKRGRTTSDVKKVKKKLIKRFSPRPSSVIYNFQIKRNLK